MDRIIYSLLFWGFMLVSSMLLFPVAVLIRLLSAPFDRRRRMLHRFTSFWGSLYTWVNPLWSVSVTGQHVVDPRGIYVIVSNHQSLADIFVLFRLRAHYKWVSKAENFRIPFIGWNMSLNGYIRIERGSLRGNLRMMRDAEAALREGNSVLMFPEGTRSPDGAMQAFKDGAFDLALRTSTPVLPLVIQGTFRVLPKRGFLLGGRQRIHLRVLPPVTPGAAGPESTAQLRERVRAQMAEALQALSA